MTWFGVIENRGPNLFIVRVRLEGEVEGVAVVGDAVFDYPSIEAARAAGWNIPGTPTREGESVPVLAIQEQTG